MDYNQLSPVRILFTIVVFRNQELKISLTKTKLIKKLRTILLLLRHAFSDYRRSGDLEGGCEEMRMKKADIYLTTNQQHQLRFFDLCILPRVGY